MDSLHAIDAAQAAARLSTVMEHVRLENDHDLKGLMETFGNDAFYDVVPAQAHFAGRAEVQKFYENFFRSSADLHLTVKSTHVASEAIVLEVEISGTHTGSELVGLPSKGKPFKFPLCAIYTFGPENKLAGERIYFDRESVRVQLV